VQKTSGAQQPPYSDNAKVFLARRLPALSAINFPKLSVLSITPISLSVRFPSVTKLVTSAASKLGPLDFMTSGLRDRFCALAPAELIEPAEPILDLAGLLAPVEMVEPILDLLWALATVELPELVVVLVFHVSVVWALDLEPRSAETFASKLFTTCAQRIVAIVAAGTTDERSVSTFSCNAFMCRPKAELNSLFSSMRVAKSMLLAEPLNFKQPLMNS